MSARSTYRLMTAFVLGLFLFLQVNSAVHAMEAEELSHGHDCVFCLAVNEDEGEIDALLDSVTTFEVRTLTYSNAFKSIFNEANRLTPQGRAPPPRGPPLTYL